MANTNQPERMPQAGQGQQGQGQQGQKDQPQPQTDQDQQGMGGRKNNEEVGEPVQLQEDMDQPQQQGPSKRQQQPSSDR